MRIALSVVLAGALAACGPSSTDEAGGPGFTDYNTYLDQRAAEIAGQTAAPSAGFSTEVIAGAIDAAESGTATTTPTATPTVTTTGDGARPRGDAPSTIQPESGEIADYVDAAVSDEQDFAAVSARETIESDKARIEANRAQYVVIQPGSLPVRPGEAGPNIVEFALATTNPVGVALYSRSRIALVSSERACLKYASPDLAQQAFLAAGGPQKDPKNLDPDGDGFACDWDPAPFRLALR